MNQCFLLALDDGLPDVWKRRCFHLCSKWLICAADICNMQSRQTLPSSQIYTFITQFTLTFVHSSASVEDDDDDDSGFGILMKLIMN